MTIDWICHDRSKAGFSRIIALPALTAGVCGVIQDWQHPHPTVGWASFHTLFGILLMCSILVQFAVQRRDFCLVARRLSRQIYLILYVLCGVRETQFLVAWVVDSGVGMGSLATVGDSMKDLQCYVGYGFLALVNVRLLTAWGQHELGAHLTGRTT
jgi:hypothetical protein